FVLDAAHDFLDLFRVELLVQRRVARQVRKHHGRTAAFALIDSRIRESRGRSQLVPALGTEFLAGRDRGAASRALRPKRRAAVSAETCGVGVGVTAAGAVHTPHCYASRRLPLWRWNRLTQCQFLRRHGWRPLAPVVYAFPLQLQHLAREAGEVRLE